MKKPQSLVATCIVVISAGLAVAQTQRGTVPDCEDFGHCPWNSSDEGAAIQGANSRAGELSAQARKLSEERTRVPKTADSNPSTIIASKEGLVITTKIGQCFQRVTQTSNIKGLTIPQSVYDAAMPAILCVDVVEVYSKINPWGDDHKPAIIMSGIMNKYSFKSASYSPFLENGYR